MHTMGNGMATRREQAAAAPSDTEEPHGPHGDQRAQRPTSPHCESTYRTLVKQAEVTCGDSPNGSYLSKRGVGVGTDWERRPGGCPGA